MEKGAIKSIEKDTVIKKLIELENKLNLLPNTVCGQYCYGSNFRNYLNIWVNCNDFYSMSVIARVFSERYLNSENNWTVSLSTNDIKTNPQFDLHIHLIDVNKTDMQDDSIIRDITNIISNLDYFMGKTFKKYFSNE